MPKFLGLDAVLAIHYDQINTFGGALGVRDQGLLEAALGQSEQTHAYTRDLCQAAAQYAVSIAKDHPFLDGNKRTAADCMLTVLLLNGVEPTLSPEQLFEWTMLAAVGKLGRPGLARRLKQQHSRKRR